MVVVRDGATILDHVKAEVRDNGITAVAGASGSGKTTLLRLCNRLEVPTSGAVRFRGDDVQTLDPLDLRRRVGMVFQRAVLFEGTVRDNLRVAAPGLSDAEFAAALRRVSLDGDLLDRLASTLSGGEAQRMCVARTLLTEPEVLLLDEPTSALNEEPKLAFERLTRELADQGVTIVWVTHDLEQLRRLDAEVIHLEAGRVVDR